MSRAKKYYNATLCYLASLSFFWRRFLFCGLGCTCLFFSCLSKKQSSACALAYKSHDKKVEGNNAKQPAFGAACRALWRGFGMFSGMRILFSDDGFWIYPIVSKTKLPPMVAVLNTRTNGATFKYRLA
jgi:hypothetical protein